MRRGDKEVTDQHLIHEILSNNYICRIALSDGKIPYLIPMNYGYSDHSFYLHTAMEGRKLDVIQRNNNVCVEVSDSIEIVGSKKACSYGTRYRSVICAGKVYLLKDIEQKIRGLKLIMQQHTGSLDWEISESAVSNVIVLKIDIDCFTGKISGM